MHGLTTLIVPLELCIWEGEEAASPFTMKWLKKQEAGSESCIAIPQARLVQME